MFLVVLFMTLPTPCHVVVDRLNLVNITIAPSYHMVLCQEIIIFKLFTVDTTKLASEFIPIKHEKFQFFLNGVTTRANHVVQDFIVCLFQLLILFFETFQFFIAFYAPKPRITSFFLLNMYLGGTFWSPRSM